jgi:hypothetical protein
VTLSRLLESEDAIEPKPRISEPASYPDEPRMRVSDSLAQAAVMRARISRVIARLPELSEERLEGIEETLFEVGALRTACSVCAHLYRPYLESCSACRRA